MAIDLQADSSTFTADFAESIVYRPLSGIPRTIQALVTRGSPESMQPHGVAPRFTIMVRNNHRYGIASDEIDTGGDCVDVAERYGETAETRSIASIMSHDPGMLTIEVR